MPIWLYAVIPSLCMLIPCACVFVYLKHQQAQDRKSPLVDDLLRLPGESLKQRFIDHAFDLSMVLTISIALPAIVIIALLTSWIDPTRIRLDFTAALASLIVVATVVWAIWNTLRILRRHSATKRGLEGEIATAQLLTPLLAEGWQLFHDLPMKRGNIDHVLVGPTGVYAIETKYRSKRSSLKGQEGALAEYDGKVIRFAGGSSEHLPAQQAQAAANELSRWLYGKVGEPVVVVPVVAIPGWFVKATQKPINGQAYVINPKAHGLFRKRPFQMETSLQIKVTAALKHLTQHQP